MAKPKKIKIPEIINIHEGTPAIICGHGPSLNDNKEKISDLQREQKIIRFSVNNWYDHFDVAPNY